VSSTPCIWVAQGPTGDVGKGTKVRALLPAAQTGGEKVKSSQGRVLITEAGRNLQKNKVGWSRRIDRG